MSLIKLDKSVCEKWIKKRTINPLTGERVIIGDESYKNLYDACIKNGYAIDYCTYKWMKIDNIDYSCYNKSRYIKCHYCKSFKILFAVHSDDDSEYKCIYCDKNIKLIYKCIKCRKINKKNHIANNKNDESESVTHSN